MGTTWTPWRGSYVSNKAAAKAGKKLLDENFPLIDHIEYRECYGGCWQFRAGKDN
jgi:hypothetical protein